MREQLLRAIENYLAGTMSLDSLEQWLLGHLQVLITSELATREIADEIDADFIHLAEELIDEAEFRKRLKGYAAGLRTIRITG